MQMQTQRIQIGGINVNYTFLDNRPDAGAPAEETLVFLHGWGTSIGIYPQLLDHMSHFVPVAAMDMPGFGETAEPDKPWGVPEFAEFVIDFMQALGLKRVILMGHSHGGRVSLEIASRKDLPLTVTRLILMDAAGVLPKKTLKQKLRQRQYKICRKILEMPLCRVLYPDALENLRRSHGSADYQNASPLMRQTLVKCVNTDMTPKMPEVSQPALLIWGENDTATPLSDGETMERLMPNAALIKVPNAGHYSYLDQWPLVSRVLASYLSGKEG